MRWISQQDATDRNSFSFVMQLFHSTKRRAHLLIATILASTCLPMTLGAQEFEESSELQSFHLHGNLRTLQRFVELSRSDKSRPPVIKAYRYVSSGCWSMYDLILFERKGGDLEARLRFGFPGHASIQQFSSNTFREKFRSNALDEFVVAMKEVNVKAPKAPSASSSTTTPIFAVWEDGKTEYILDRSSLFGSSGDPLAKLHPCIDGILKAVTKTEK
jgi:hypothetical protein